ncbi:MAG: energy transducer TonB [Pseudomonadota bacterium]
MHATINRALLSLQCAFFLVLPAALDAAERGPSGFDAAYTHAAQELDRYRKGDFLVGLEESPAIREAVSQAYMLGKQTGADPLMLAELAANYGSVLRIPAEAEQELDYAIDLVDAYQKQHGDSEALIKPLISIGHLNYDFGGMTGANKYYRRAFKLADKYWNGQPGDQQRLADLYREAGVNLSFHSHVAGKDYLKDALEIYSALSDNAGIAATSMHLGRFWIRRGQYVQAERYLQDGLAALGDKSTDTATFVGLHTQFVRLYSLTYKPELAGQHSQIIGATYAGKTSDELTLLYSTTLRYPPNALALRESGEVTVSFTVNELGEVVNPVVVDRKGHHEFELAALNAIRFARYAPRFVDGQAVATDNVHFTFSFAVND